MPHRMIYYRWMCDHCPQLYDVEVDCIVHERTCAAASAYARQPPADSDDKLRSVVTLLQTDTELLNVVNELINSRQEQQLPVFNDMDEQQTMLAEVDAHIAHSENDAAAVDEKQACSLAIVVESISPTKTAAQEGKPRRRQRPQRQCRYCPRTLDSPSKLRAHERTHTGERPEECDICHKRFALKCNLTLHRRRHTGERPYQCRHCDHCYLSSDDRAIHERVGGVRACAHTCVQVTHTGERPYECTVCRATFNRLTSFRFHKLTHQTPDEYQFECDVCKHRFPRKDTMIYHQQRCGKSIKQAAQNDQADNRSTTANPIKPTLKFVRDGQFLKAVRLKRDKQIITDSK